MAHELVIHRKKSYLDITNKKFNRLTAIEYLGKPKLHHMWKCRCDCGNITKVAQSAIMYSKIKSCGCIQKGRKAPNIMDNGVAASHALISAYKAGAKRRHIEYKLDNSTFLELTKKECMYCGAVPSKIYKTGNSKTTGVYIYNGVDRLDNSKGYIIGNCVPCCTVCNTAKASLSLEEFKTWINKVHQRLNGK